MPEGTPLEQTDRVDRRRSPTRSATRARGRRTTRPTSGRRGPTTSTASSGTTSCARARTSPTSRSTSSTRTTRKAQSHAIAKRVRERDRARSPRASARASRSPRCRPGRRCSRPWSPRSTAPTTTRDIAIAQAGPRARSRRRAGVVDVDWYVEDDQPKYRFVVDQEKAALDGVSEAEIVRALALASAGETRGAPPRRARERGRADRAPPRSRDALGPRSPARACASSGADGNLVSVGELVHPELVTADKSIYHKNLMPVVYVTADVAGAIESPVYAILAARPAELDAMTAARGVRARAAHRGAAVRATIATR